MADGRREEWRRIVLSQAWAIGSLFGDSPGGREIEQFIRTGVPGTGSTTKEPKHPLVDDVVADILKTGKLTLK